MFDQYARQQRGGSEFPVYIGRASKQGHGLGNILGILLRRILPFIKAIAPHALRAGANVRRYELENGRGQTETRVYKRLCNDSAEANG